MKTPAISLIVVVSTLAAALPAISVRAETLSAQGRVVGSLFNTTSRQHIQAKVTGSGVVRPGGDTGTANGKITSLPNERVPQSTVLGLYRVLAQATVRYDGGSESVSETALLDVNRRSIIVRGFGRVDLDRPVDPQRKGRQRFSGGVSLIIRNI